MGLMGVFLPSVPVLRNRWLSSVLLGVLAGPRHNKGAAICGANIWSGGRQRREVKVVHWCMVPTFAYGGCWTHTRVCCQGTIYCSV